MSVFVVLPVWFQGESPERRRLVCIDLACCTTIWAPEPWEEVYKVGAHLSINGVDYSTPVPFDQLAVALDATRFDVAEEMAR